MLIIDMINDLEFPEGPELLPPALRAANCIAALKEQANQKGIPVIYANDNFGHWRSDLNALVEHCLHDGVRGQPITELLRPQEDDYVVLKPKHSAFFATTLELLLTYLGTEHLILTGLSADVCVQFTAQDAFLRDFTLSIPADCIAACSKDQTQQCLSYMQRVLKADTTPSPELNLDQMLLNDQHEQDDTDEPV
jgi:nicotinamidase-related amidase